MRYAAFLLTVACTTFNVCLVYADEDRDQFYAFLEKNISNLVPSSFLPSKGFIFMTTSGENIQKWVNQCMSNPGDNPYRLTVHYFIRIGQTRNTEKLQSMLAETKDFAQKNPKFFWAQYVHIANLLKAGDKEQFRDRIQNFMRMEPEDAYGYLILVQLGLAIEDYDYVDKAFKKSTKKYQNIAILFHEYGSFLEKYKKDLDEAARQYLKAITINGYKDSYLDLAALYAGQERYEEAIEVYDEALRKYPSDANFLRSKGIVFVLMNRSSEGIPLIEEAIKIEPKDGKTYWLLGMAYKANQDKSKACAAFKKAVELGYEDAEQSRKEYCE